MMIRNPRKPTRKKNEESSHGNCSKNYSLSTD